MSGKEANTDDRGYDLKGAIREDQISVSPIDRRIFTPYEVKEVGIGDDECRPTLDIWPSYRPVSPSHDSDFSRKMTIFSPHLFIIKFQ